MTEILDTLAATLDEAALSACPVPQLTTTRELSLDDAYGVQRALVDRRVARGDHYVGVKLGFTSQAKMAQMGVSDVIIGRLTAGMRLLDGGRLDPTRFVHPRVEPEIAFRFGRTIDPDDQAVDVESAVDAVAPALEVIDSRYRDFRFSLVDVVADNTSAAGFVLGPWRPYGEDIGDRSVTLEMNGSTAETGSTAAILGHPVRALHAAVRMAARYQVPLPAGSLVLAGAATAAVSLAPGVVVAATVARLGRVRLAVEAQPDE